MRGKAVTVTSGRFNRNILGYKMPNIKERREKYVWKKE